jgi:5'-nucleotidase
MISDLKNTRILISNDDGIEAEGIALLERIAHTLSDDVWVVAPAHENSGAGHSLSLHSPLRYRKHSERRWSVVGTPTDAVLVGVMEIMKDKRPGLMLSGVNRGSNLAEDITYSGTVSAAMEATLLDIPSIALSNQITEEGVDWRVPEQYAAGIIRTLTQLSWPSSTLMNVNFPALPLESIKGVRPCPHGRRVLDDNLHRRVDPHGRPYIWIGGQRTEPFGDQPTADLHQIREGWITVTPIDLDMTNYPLLEKMHGLVFPA